MGDDLRSLRKQNQALNKANPIVPEENKGSLGDRDPATGKRRTRLDNGGSFQAKELFQSSPGQSTQVQLNSNTQTADYKSIDREKERRDGLLLKKKANPATGKPNPDIKEETDPEQDNPENQNFGNCDICSGTKGIAINCPSGKARVTFFDGTTQIVEGQGETEYGAKVTFNYASGQGGSLYTNTCGSVAINQCNKPINKDKIDPAYYGDTLYSQNASAVSLGSISGTNLVQFQIRKKDCIISIIGIAENGFASLLGQTTCDDLGGGYSILPPKNCISLGEETAYNVDLESLSYQCVTRLYQYCQKYRVYWVTESTGETAFFESCEPISFRIQPIESKEEYLPGARSVGVGILKYDSGIPKKFVVSAGGENQSSGEYGFFQIYQDPSNECSYEVVGVKVKGDRDIFSGAVSNNEYATIYSGGCGFVISLGDYVADLVLEIVDDRNNVLYETFDFIPISVVSERSQKTERVAVLEKAVSSDIPNGASIKSIECIS